MRKILKLALVVPVVTALAGCATNADPLADYDPTWPEESVPAPTGGAIYQAGHEVALFENPTARRVGDVITIRLQEKTDASKSSSTSTSKKSDASIAGPVVIGRPVTVNGTEVLKGSLASDTGFDGQGGSKQSNSLEGDVTVAVVKRLSNGNLFVRGQKWIGINQGQEFIRVQGVIRPIDIQPDNSVPSYKVANAMISYGGKGALANANKQGLLARFFNSPWIPF